MNFTKFAKFAFCTLLGFSLAALNACTVSVSGDTPPPPPPERVSGKAGGMGWSVTQAVARINNVDNTIYLLMSGNGYSVSCDSRAVPGVSFATYVSRAIGTTRYDSTSSGLSYFGRVDAFFRRTSDEDLALRPARSTVTIDSIQPDRITGWISSEAESYYIKQWNIQGAFTATLCP